MADNKINVGGRLHSIATGNVLGGADEILDDSKNKKQSDINTETYSLVNDVNERLSGLSPDQQSALSVAAKATNNETKLGYYVCGTEGNLAAKVISNATGYVLSTGGSMKVKMINRNTSNNATLNINSTGAKALYYQGERASSTNSWDDNEVIEVYYDGTNYYANNVNGGSNSNVYDVSIKHPTGGPNEDGKFTIEYILDSNNVNELIPVNKRYPRMMIRFISSINNKYIQYKLRLLTFSNNDFNKVDNWYLCLDDSLHTQPITLVNGYIKPDGTIYSGGNAGWTHSDYILIDDILGDTIELSKNTSSNTSGPSAIPMATYDSEYNPVDYPNVVGKTTYNKSDFSANAKYIAFTFYYKSDVIISNYAVRDQIRTNKSRIDNHEIRVDSLEENFNGQEVTLIPGYVKSDGQIVNQSGVWTHSDYIDLDTVLDKTIILNKSTNINASNPAVAPMAVYDSNHELIYVTQESTGNTIYKILSDNAKYVVFSFYAKSDVFILNSSMGEKVNYVNTKINDLILRKPVTLVKGFIQKDTGVIQNINIANYWYHTNPILIEHCIGDTIELSRGSNSNDAGPAAAGYATYDEKLQPITVHNSGSGLHVDKSEFGEGSVYIAFSYFLPSLTDIYILNGSTYGCLEIEFNKIKDLGNRVSVLENSNTILSRNIQKDAAVRVTGTKAVTSDIKPLSFIHISDIHTKGDNYKCFENACEFYEHYSNIKFMIATGDLVWDTYHDPTTWYDLALANTSKPVLNVIGNHDAGQYNATYGLGSQSSDLECYNKFIAPYVNAGTLPNGVTVPGWEVIQPTNAATDGKSYYYKDFTDEKIRLIVLNEFETDYEIDPNDNTKLLYSREFRAMRQAQVDWLIASLTSTPSDYGVIVAYHQPDNLAEVDNEFVSFDLVGSYRSAHGSYANIANVYCNDKEWLPKILNAFATKSSLTLTVTQTGAVVTSSPTLICDCDFTNIQAEFICILNGHTHRDYIGHLTNYPALKVLCVGADNLLYTSGFQPRAAGTPSEDLFNVVNIDRNRKTIKVIRIGSDASVTGQVRDQMIMSYATT